MDSLKADPQNILDNPGIASMIDKVLAGEDFEGEKKKDLSQLRAKHVNFSMDINYDDIEESLILVDNENKVVLLQESLQKK